MRTKTPQWLAQNIPDDHSPFGEVKPDTVGLGHLSMPVNEVDTVVRSGLKGALEASAPSVSDSQSMHKYLEIPKTGFLTNAIRLKGLQDHQVADLLLNEQFDQCPKETLQWELKRRAEKNRCS